MKKINYADLFTLRKDGVYQKYVNGKYIYSKDPEQLYEKWQNIIKGPPEKTFKEVASDWENEHREEIGYRTWNNYRPHFDAIVARYGDTPISQISAQDVNSELLRAKAQGYSLTVVKTIKTIFTQILDFAVLNNYLKYNPALSVKLPKGLPKGKRQGLTEDEMRIVMNSLDKPFGFFAYFLLCTGMRKSEALALSLEDIDLDAREINISKSLESVYSKPVVKSPKTENGVRTVPIVDALYEPLKARMKEVPGDLLFPANKSNRNAGGGYMTEKAYEVAWKNYCETTGLNITAHQLRHGAATIMFETGVDELTAQRILGHSNISITREIYTDLRAKQNKKSINKFNKGISKYVADCVVKE